MTTTDKPDDALEQSEALKRLLTNLAQNYYEGDDGPIEIRWTDQPSASAGMEGTTPVVRVNVNVPWTHYEATGAHALRLLADTVNHEVEHHNTTVIESKREFMEDHNDGYAKLAGMAINVLEDNHIDHKRTRKYRGLKQVRDWQIQDLMENDEARPPMGEIDDQGHQAIEGFTQLAFSGRVKGITDADPDVQAALEDVSPLCEQVKHEDDPARRMEMADEVVTRLKEVIPERPDLPDWLKDLIEEIMEDLENNFDPEDAPDDEAFDPSAAEGEGEADGEGDGDEDGEADGEGEAEGSGEADDAEDADGEGGAGDGEGESTSRQTRTVTQLLQGRDDASTVRIE